MFVYTAGATAIAGDLQVSPTYIGYQIGIAYFAATLCTLFSSSITRRVGAVSALAIAMACLAAGAAVSTFWKLTGMVTGSVIMGLGFGLIPAAASQVLIAVSGKTNRALIFSIKQSGIPVGGMLAALTTPFLTEVWGWRAAGYSVCIASLILFILLFVNRRRWVNVNVTSQSVPLNPLLPLMAVRGSKSLVLLIYMALCYVGVQIVLLTFLSPYFVQDIEISLLEAGYLLAVIQVTGIFGRIVWGWLSDHLQDNFTSMVILGVVMTICCVSIDVISVNLPSAFLILLCVFIGLSAVSWNGVFHAALIEVSPPNDSVQVIAGMAFYVYVAMFVWPPLFAFLIAESGSYTGPFILLALLSLAGVYFGMQARRQR